MLGALGGLSVTDYLMTMWESEYQTSIAEAVDEARRENAYLPSVKAAFDRGYQQGQQDIFAFHPEWTVTGMCKPDCLPCQRLTELINERSAGYEEGLHDREPV